MPLVPHKWKNEKNPLGPPADSGTATEVSAESLKAMEERSGAYTDRSAPMVAAKTYGVVADGATDDIDGWEDALDACPEGGYVACDGMSRISRELVVPRGKGIFFPYSSRWAYTFEPKTGIKPLPSFEGDSVIRMKDREEGGYAVEQGGQRFHLCIDGSELPEGSTVHGIYATGLVKDVDISGCIVRKVTGDAFRTEGYTRSVIAPTGKQYPRGWRGAAPIADHPAGVGFNFELMNDADFLDVLAVGAGSHGIEWDGPGESALTGRAVFNGARGLYLTGEHYGGMRVPYFGTDRNDQHGIFTDCQGELPIQFGTLALRRDGDNGEKGGGGYAGFAAGGATCPIFISNLAITVDEDDTGNGVFTPEYGLKATNSARLVVASGCLWGKVEGFKDGGGNTAGGIVVGPNVKVQTGKPGSVVGANAGAFEIAHLGEGGGFVVGTAVPLAPFYSTSAKDKLHLYLKATGAGPAEPLVLLEAVAAVDKLLSGVVTGDAARRFALLADGKMEWGGGAGARDSYLTRIAKEVLETNAAIIAKGSKQGQAKTSGGAKQFGLPGARFYGQGTSELSVNKVRYVVLRPDTPITITDWKLEVTTAAGTKAKMRVAIYAANSSHQPPGAPLYDSGNIEVVTAGESGAKTYPKTGLTVELQPGTYLVAVNTDTALTVRTFLSPTDTVAEGLGASALVQRYQAAQTFGAFPTPGTEWSEANASTGGQQNIVVFRWTE